MYYGPLQLRGLWLYDNTLAEMLVNNEYIGKYNDHEHFLPC